jgi:hypothetical protein
MPLGTFQRTPWDSWDSRPAWEGMATATEARARVIAVRENCILNVELKIKVFNKRSKKFDRRE